MRVLAVDPGGRRLGLAVGDEATGVVSPVGVVPYPGLEGAVDLILDEAERLGAGRVVIGLPTDVDGGRTDACRRSELLARTLVERGIGVSLQREYLTSDEARRRARERGRHRQEAIDDLAAQVILEEHLAAR